MIAIAIVAELRARSESCAEFAKVLSELAVGVATETGNLVYTVGRSRNDACVFRVLEVYASQEALEAHRAAPHTLAAQARFKPLLAAAPAVDFHEVIAMADKGK